jgi:hypothetical protein
VLSMAKGRLTQLVALMRWTGMALVDAHRFGMSLEDSQKLGLSKPERRPMLENETLVRGNRTKRGALSCPYRQVVGEPAKGIGLSG